MGQLIVDYRVITWPGLVIGGLCVVFSYQWHTVCGRFSHGRLCVAFSYQRHTVCGRQVMVGSVWFLATSGIQHEGRYVMLGSVWFSATSGIQCVAVRSWWALCGF